MSDWKELLKEAKELFDDGIIDEAEFKALKAEAFALRRQRTTAPQSMSDTFAGSATGFGTAGGGLSDGFAGGQTQLQAGQIIGNYRILSEMGKGGMGVVYRARHQIESFAIQTGDVVIKMMHTQYAQDENFRNRFISEAAIGRNILHANIIRIHDVIVDEERNILAIVMDLAEGRPLEDLIPQNGLPFEKALPIIEQLCEAIDYMHIQGIIHRDLKPENIIVSSSGKVTILDMGIAKNTQRNMGGTRTGMAMGTPLYMAPEQGDAKNITAAADRYALGLIVYRMLSGAFPWVEDAGEYSIVSSKMMGNLIPLKEKVNTKSYVSDAVMKLLNPEATLRWQNGSSFLKALKTSHLKYLKPVSFGTGRARQEMVLIPAGEFMMGALPNDEHANDNEKPRHKVRISRDFYVGKYLVTQKLWGAVIGNNPSKHEGENRPVDRVSWFDCLAFCNKLSKLEGREPVYQGLEGYQIGQVFDDKDQRGESEKETQLAENISCNWNANGYRLLSEAEWEYAARGGEYHLYSGSNNADEVSVYWDNSGQETLPVGTLKSNGFGLYDMSGNVYEWVWDRRRVYLEQDIVQDPHGAPTGLERVVRGGSWGNSARGTRLSYRGTLDPKPYKSNFGFRLGCFS